MNKRKLFAAISAAAVLVSAVPAVNVSAEPLPPYPQWVPSTYADALDFVNEYGVVRTENSVYWQGIVCVVNRFAHYSDNDIARRTMYSEDAELLDTQYFTFEWPDDSKVGDPDYPYAETIYDGQLQLLGLTEEMRESGSYHKELAFEVDVFRVKPGGSATITAMDGDSGIEYTFECDDQGCVTQTDIYSWLPDSAAEYNAFKLSYPTVSAQHGYIVFCSDYAGDGGYQIFPEIDGPAALCREVEYNEVVLGLIDGGRSGKIMVYEPAGEGTVNAGFTENQEWMIGKQEPVHSYSADFEITRNGDEYEITDLSWWKDHEHNTFYKDGEDNGGNFFGCLHVPETFYGEPVEKAVIADIPNIGSIRLPDSVKDVDIRNCPYLNGFYISDFAPNFDVYQFNTAGRDALFSRGLGKILCYPPNYCADKIVLPEETTAIGKGAFRDAVYLSEVTAKNVTEIGEDAFEGCSGLKLYVSSENLSAVKSQLGEEFTDSGNSIIPINSSEDKNWEYYCSLTDEQVLEEYQKYFGQNHGLTGERFVKDGILYGDIAGKLKFEIAYGLLDPCSFTFNAVALSTYMPVDGEGEPGASSFGFPEDVTVTFDHWKGAPSRVYFADDRMDSRSAYDFMRRELTLYNSVYYRLYSEQDGHISWCYNDFIPEYLPGDANGDAQVTLNDAVAVLQQVALPEKYPIIQQCADLADCDGTPGISALDALAIQEFDAGTRTSLGTAVS